MKIYVDENVPQKIATRLKEGGYKVEYVGRSVEDRTLSAIDVRHPLL